MQILEKLGWEIKFPLILSLIAFIISFVAGIVSGNPGGVILMRAFIFAFVFGGLTFGGIFILKKFVPEIYEALFSALPVSDFTEGEIREDHQPPVFSAEAGEDVKVSEEPSLSAEEPKPEFVSAGLDRITSSDTTKMGRHILEEKGLKYQPKIMAEAIRTMLSKDNE